MIQHLELSSPFLVIWEAPALTCLVLGSQFQLFEHSSLPPHPHHPTPTTTTPGSPFTESEEEVNKVCLSRYFELDNE